MPRLFAGFSAVLIFVCLSGCGSSEPQNIMENADEQALADYDAMIEADSNQMSDVDKSDTTDAK